MPKNLFQEIIFTIMMVFVMVYIMICYNIGLNMGGLTNEAFLLAFHELVFMAPIAFVLDFFIVGPIAKKKAFKIVNPRKDNPFLLVVMISVISIIGMCPLMSLAATIIIKQPATDFVAVWLQTTAFNFPMAFFLQLCFAGPLVRFIFGLIFRESREEVVIEEGEEAGAIQGE